MASGFELDGGTEYALHGGICKNTQNAFAIHRSRSSVNCVKQRSADESDREKPWGKPAKPWKSANRPITGTIYWNRHRVPLPRVISKNILVSDMSLLMDNLNMLEDLDPGQVGVLAWDWEVGVLAWDREVAGRKWAGPLNSSLTELHPVVYY